MKRFPMALAVLALVLIATQMVLAGEGPSPASSDGRACNVYEIDPIYVDIFDNWQTIGRTEMHFLIWGAFRPDATMIDLHIEPSKTGQRIHGIERKGLGLPLPKALRFKVWLDTTYLWVVLGDKQGRRVSSRIPVEGLRPCRWCDIELPVERMVPMGVGAKPITDLDLIAFLTRESAGEVEEAPVRIVLTDIEAVYPKGTGPTNPTFTKDDLAELIKPLPARIQVIDDLLGEAKAKGIDVRYPLVSRTVLDRYTKEVPSMYRDKDPFVTKRTAEFLLKCAKRTERELRSMLRDPRKVIPLPDVSLKHLRCREGTFFSKDRPVFLAGVCGWFNPGYFRQLSSMGYTALSIEIGPRSMLPEEGVVKRDGAKGILAVMDAATKHNMVCDLLVSPHYFPSWARKKWPGTDVTGWRQKTNNFMPWTITSPHFREIIAKHLSVLIPQVREHPALLSYDLINEAWYRLIPGFPKADWDAYRKKHPKRNEWQALSRFGTETVTDFLRWYIAELHKHDKTHPVHIKTIDTPSVLSIDREAVGEVLTANGMDAMPSWPDWTGRLGADYAWPFLRHDFHRTLQPDQPIMDGEYHISGGTYAQPSNYFQTALWGLALHGRDMTACWVFDRVDDVSLYWHANGVEALGRTALDFLRLGKEIHAFQRSRGPIALYYGGTNTSDAYRACLFQDLDIGVLTDKRIRGGALADSKVFVIPANSGLGKDILEKVEAFRQSGGVVARCQKGPRLPQLWRAVRRAVRQAELPKLVETDLWGVECRSLRLEGRKLFYVINHRRKPVVVEPKSAWPLRNAMDLITMTSFDASRFRLDPLETRLVEVE